MVKKKKKKKKREEGARRAGGGACACNNGDTGFEHATVTRNFCRELQKARLEKKMTQKMLAGSINEKAGLINDYESGAARPNQLVINKLNRALNVQLPSATKPPHKKKRR